MMETFTVNHHQLVCQMVAGSTSRDDHRFWADPSKMIITTDGPRPIQQVVSYLMTDDWSHVTYSTCGEQSCIRLDHLTTSPEVAETVKDEQLMALVQRTSVSLADLYRKGKKRGLITSRVHYH